ncbi:hypothetical protein H2199_008974 [Coniosporium tulheliwenetii]|uniref:Uncharacterized protein n=1 Tax=Coniosporium tulheliwenetii TaxID=3383036 RepID=A0ACC2YH05_9PEZI|nr:hypothetical protein H2199_008974 [Cladosporium sp. JES 115]
MPASTFTPATSTPAATASWVYSLSAAPDPINPFTMSQRTSQNNRVHSLGGTRDVVLKVLANETFTTADFHRLRQYPISSTLRHLAASDGLSAAGAKALSADNIINGPIRDVFVNHNAHQSFWLYVQHGHHTVGSNETVVKVNGTAHMMDTHAVEAIISFGNKVVPTTWMASGGEMRPMEFALVPAATVTCPPTPAFLSDFLSVLAINRCDEIFGIDTIAKGGAWIEMKIGEASVTVPMNDGDCDNQEEFIAVAFIFDKEKPEFRVHGRCGKDHKHTTKPK